MAKTMPPADLRAAVARAEGKILRDWIREHGSPFTKRLVAIGDAKKAKHRVAGPTTEQFVTAVKARLSAELAMTRSITITYTEDDLSATRTISEEGIVSFRQDVLAEALGPVMVARIKDCMAQVEGLKRKRK